MEVVKIERFGVFTVAEVKDENGKIGVGISKRSRNDKISDELGQSIALGRAKKALKLKLEKKALRSSYMG